MLDGRKILKKEYEIQNDWVWVRGRKSLVWKTG